MARKVFFSFYYAGDGWRASQVRQMGALEGNAPCSDNDWETVKKGGDKAIEKWIAEQLAGKSCTVVLVGGETANRKWVIHETSESWNENKGVVGIRIHNLLDSAGSSGVYGANPFDLVTFKNDGKKLSSLVKLYNPSGANSTDVYKSIKANIADWVEEAIAIRASTSCIIVFRTTRAGASQSVLFKSCVEVKRWRMSDATGHMDRPGDGPSSSMMAIGGVPINHYIHDNPTTWLVEIVRPMPPNVLDVVVKEFPNRAIAWAWAEAKWHAGRLR